MLQLFNADDGSALREPATAQERPFFALSDYQFTVFALVTLYSSGLRRRLGRQDVTFFVDTEDGFTVWIVAAPQERPESAMFMHHWLAADGTIMFALLLFNHPAFSVAGAGEFAFRVIRTA